MPTNASPSGHYHQTVVSVGFSRLQQEEKPAKVLSLASHVDNEEDLQLPAVHEPCNTRALSRVVGYSGKNLIWILYSSSKSHMEDVLLDKCQSIPQLFRVVDSTEILLGWAIDVPCLSLDTSNKRG